MNFSTLLKKKPSKATLSYKCSHCEKETAISPLCVTCLRERDNALMALGSTADASPNLRPFLIAFLREGVPSHYSLQYKKLKQIYPIHQIPKSERTKIVEMLAQWKSVD